MLLLAHNAERTRTVTHIAARARKFVLDQHIAEIPCVTTNPAPARAKAPMVTSQMQFPI